MKDKATGKERLYMAVTKDTLSLPLAVADSPAELARLRGAKSLKINGCNYFGKSTIRSAPFAIFNRQDILQLALELDVPVPAIYGTIERKEDGTLYTTKAQRTGCSMCGFGIHMEKRPHRFDLLRERNEKEWKFWMYDIGWGHVLDYIGVEWETPVAEQMKIGEV